jgi:hypothetical protein
VHSRCFGQGLLQRHDFLNDCHQCSWRKLGKSPIRVRVNILRSTVDENGEGYFPSPTTENCSRALLDAYGAEVIGYHLRHTKYGEVYYIYFEHAF